MRGGQRARLLRSLGLGQRPAPEDSLLVPQSPPVAPVRGEDPDKKTAASGGPQAQPEGSDSELESEPPSKAEMVLPLALV